LNPSDKDIIVRTGGGSYSAVPFDRAAAAPLPIEAGVPVGT
jgi:hypothetical protein